MPYQRVNGKKMSSHWWTSPLKDAEMRACRQCYSDKSPEYLKSRVLYTQEKTFANLLDAQDASVRAHEAVRLADAWTGERAPNFDQLLIEARDMIRKGQMFWDFVSAENSIGFHNPAKALDTIYISTQSSRRATDLALQASGTTLRHSLKARSSRSCRPSSI